MKKILAYLLLSIGIAANISAADFLATFSQYDNQIKRKLGIVETDTNLLPDTVTHDFVREAVVSVMPLIRGSRITTTFVTSPHQNTYTLDTLLTGIISVQWSSNDTNKSLVYVPVQSWYQQEHKTTLNERGYTKIPSYYDFTEDQIFLSPTPTSRTADTIKIFGYRKVPSISAVDSLAIIPQEYRVAILLCATYKAGKSIGSTYTSFYKQAFDESIAILLGMRPGRVDVKTSN